MAAELSVSDQGIAPLMGEVSDPTGDSRTDPQIPVSPDLVHAIARVASGNVTFTVQLAPGTLDPQTTRVVILLDTDQSASTGIGQVDGMGIDYIVQMISTRGSIAKANPVTCAAGQGCYDFFSSTPVIAVSDGMQVTVPLATLGNSDGHMTFKLHAAYVTTAIGQTPSPSVSDYMPDLLLPPGRVR
jgi:hypothetical protein